MYHFPPARAIFPQSMFLPQEIFGGDENLDLCEISGRYSLGRSAYSGWSAYAWETGGMMFRERCCERKSSAANSPNSLGCARNLVSSSWHTNNRLRGTH